MSAQGKYDVHVVEMVRNNGIADGINKGYDCFFLFDYFDVLYHKELIGQNKRYENYLCIKDSFEDYQKYKVSYKVLSLYKKNNQQGNTKDPFQLTKNINGLSDVPFIGLIQITLCKENYEDASKAEDLEIFLQNCEESICSVVQKIEASQHRIEASQLYRSSTTGDFCLVLRTDSVDTIYQIASALGNMPDKKSGKKKLFTYTSVGMECKTNEEGDFCTLTEDFVKSHPDLTVALRFSATAQFGALLKAYAGQKSTGNKVKEVKGLFGRYDYLLNMDIEEFAEVYPVLCGKKLGKPDSKLKESQSAESESVNALGQGDVSICKEEGTASIGNAVPHKLSDIIEKGFAQNINERILVDFSAYSTGRQLQGQQEEEQNIIEQNNDIHEKVKALDAWEEYYEEEHGEVKELLRCMKEMCRTFLPVGMEQDAYVNWLTFCKDMSVLCDCINREMKAYECRFDRGCSEEELKKYRVGMLLNWRANIQAINQYTRLVQNVNYQTYQSPVYEIQTQIDTEKAMVAYREVMENYLYLYHENMGSGEDKRDCIRTLIYPEMARSGVMVGAPFTLRGNREMVDREIFCTVPSFEYFGRLYDLLPWLIHECSHQIRVLPRGCRNQFMVKSIMEEVFKSVALHAFFVASDDNLYGQIGKVERRLKDALVKAAYQDIFSGIGAGKMENFFDSADNKAENSSFEEIVLRIKIYLSRLFEIEYTFLEQKEEKWESREAIRKKVAEELLNIYREQGLEDEEVLDEINAVSKNESAVREIQEAISRLLGSYGQHLIEKIRNVDGHVPCTKETIQLEDLQVHICELDKRLIETAKQIESKVKIESKQAVHGVLKHYCFSVKKLYRIYRKYKSSLKKANEDAYIDLFLPEVFANYQKEKEKRAEDEFDLCTDPTTHFALRNLGLLNGDRELFCSQLKRFMRDKSMREIEEIVEFRLKQYRETTADILMVRSLQLGSFGYCRQVFQTISDTKIDKKRNLYDSVNMERFRLVTAVLLDAEGAKDAKDAKWQESEWNSEEEISIEGESLINKGKIYCEYSFKCILQKLFQRQEEDAKEHMDETEKELMKELLGKMNLQISEYLKDMTKESYKSTLLYFMLHKESIKNQEMTKDFWERKYSCLEKYLARSYYQFFRIEYFCMGLQQILTKKRVAVPKEQFSYFKGIWKNARSKLPKGCKWEEKMTKCLADPKLNVGAFYNEPEQVYTLDAGKKLDNTIDFIQNYYYNNRFRVMATEMGK